MSDLRNQFELAKLEYQSSRYGGNLADELLANPRRALRLTRWLAPILTAAIAASIAVVWSNHRPVSGDSRPPLAIATQTVVATRGADWASAVGRLPGVPVEAVVSDVSSGMRDAVSQIRRNVGGALDAPVVTAGVATARQVAGELGEFASVTWEQLRPRR